MNVKSLSMVELVFIRNWMVEVYSSGKAFVSVDKKQLALLFKKLEEVDRELLNKALSEDRPFANFVDENFETTLEQIRGRIDENFGETIEQMKNITGNAFEQMKNVIRDEFVEVKKDK